MIRWIIWSEKCSAAIGCGSNKTVGKRTAGKENRREKEPSEKKTAGKENHRERKPAVKTEMSDGMTGRKHIYFALFLCLLFLFCFLRIYSQHVQEKLVK